MREQDEFAGSTVRHSEIRFAQTGIETRGLPFHSQLTGEGSTDGPTIDLGNIASSDRGTISVAGTLDNPGDVNRYTFSVSRQDIQSRRRSSLNLRHPSTLTSPTRSVAPTRRCLLYQVNGNNRTLIAVGGDSNIVSDQASPLLGNDLSDLTRGSSGFQDPFLGTIELDAGNYEVAVINNAQVAEDLRFQFGSNPIGTNPLARIEPVNSVRRIAEDRFNGFVSDVAVAPVQQVFTGANNAVPFTLGDVDLLVLRNDDNNTTQLESINSQSG